MALRLGLRQVEGLRRESAERLVAAAPFASVDELRRRGAVPPAAIEQLAAADAFRSIGLDRRAALWEARALQPAPDLPLFAHAAAREEGAEAEPAVLPAMPLSEHVVADYQTARLSLKAHPLRFLRGHYQQLGFVTAQQLASLRDGGRLALAGLVLIRQRPGSAKGVVFITLEDETGVANLVIWPDVFTRQRRIIMGARLMAVRGLVQRDEGVIHVVARRLEDDSHLLSHLSDGLMDPPLAPGDQPGTLRPPTLVHPRNVDCMPRSRDFH